MANVNLPLDDSLLATVDRARAKQPRVSWIRDAIEEKLALDRDVGAEGLRFVKAPLPPTPGTALRGRVEPAKVSVEPSPPPPEITELKAKLAAKANVPRPGYQIAPADCPHKYRDGLDRCFGCGEAR